MIVKYIIASEASIAIPIEKNYNDLRTHTVLTRRRSAPRNLNNI